MTALRQQMESLAQCLTYPRADTALLADDTALALCAYEPALSAALWALARLVRTEGLAAAQEHYTVIFDLKPVCTLHLGYHIYGDTYARGELLAGLAAELRHHAIPRADDLPDYLPTLLLLWARLTDPEDRQLLEAHVLGPGLARMAQVLADATHPWACLIQALAALWPAEVPHRPSAGLPILGQTEGYAHA